MGQCQTCFRSCLDWNGETKPQKNRIRDESYYVNSQVAFSNTVLTIQSSSISELNVDILLMFVDNPQAVFNNPFIKKLRSSTLTNLSEKIANRSNLNGESCARVNIIDPFYQVPTKRLVIATVKVWDGVVHHDRYLKNIIESQITKVTKLKDKISIAVMEIDENLGYNLKDFYKILMRKLKEYSEKFNYIVYITSKRADVERFILSDFPAAKETDSNISESSVYF